MCSIGSKWITDYNFVIMLPLSVDAVSAAQITMRLREDGNFTSGLVHSSNKQSLAVSIKTYLAMLAFADNPMPSGRAASFLSMTSAKVYVEFAIVNARLRRGILEAVTRERHGESGVRILRLLLDTGKLDEKQVGCVSPCVLQVLISFHRFHGRP